MCDPKASISYDAYIVVPVRGTGTIMVSLYGFCKG